MDNLNKEPREKTISIPLVPVLLPIIILIFFAVFSFNKYVNGLSTNDNVELSTNEVLDSNVNVSIIENVIKDTSEKKEDNNSDIDENIVSNDEVEESQESPKVATYTLSNGESYDVIATLNIPSLNIKYPILSSTSTELLKVALNKYWGANPNEVGNMVVVGHNYKNNKFFSKLPNIEHGAIVEITDLNGRTLKYKVYDTSVIDPYDNSCTSQLTNGQTEITLITCYYENGSVHATKRFVAKARAN